MSFRDADAYVAGINDLVNGNEKYGVMSAAGEDGSGAASPWVNWPVTGRHSRPATRR